MSSVGAITAHDLARRGGLDGPEVGGVLVEPEMDARPVVVSEVAGDDAMEMSLIENENLIQAFASDRADERSANGFLLLAAQRGLSDLYRSRTAACVADVPVRAGW
jgi:CBS domain-containing protein